MNGKSVISSTACSIGWSQRWPVQPIRSAADFGNAWPQLASKQPRCYSTTRSRRRKFFGPNPSGVSPRLFGGRKPFNVEFARNHSSSTVTRLYSALFHRAAFADYVCEKFLAEAGNPLHRYAFHVLLSGLFPETAGPETMSARGAGRPLVPRPTR